MVPAGAAAVDVIELPDEDGGGCRHEHAHVLRPAREQAGALARVSQLFARRGYNIESLAVGPTERRDISRLTLRVDCSEHTLEQIEKQMHKLVNVLRVTELQPGRGGRARAGPDHRRRSARTPRGTAPARRGLGARVADLGRDAIMFEIVGRPEEVESFEELVRPYGVRELVRTGRIGLRRPARTPTAPPVNV